MMLRSYAIAFIGAISWILPHKESAGQERELPAGVVFADDQLPASASPWVFWYMMYASYSREAITADLEAMKTNGIAGAYLATIKGKTEPPLFEPVTETLTSEWWDLLAFIFAEADRIGINIALLPNDGFATAGGPWITPELSMQRVVWTDTVVSAGVHQLSLVQPEAYEDYYRDIAVYAFPVGGDYDTDSWSEEVRVTTSTGADAQFLNDRQNTNTFGSNDPLWIQYAFERPFTCRSIEVTIGNYSVQGNRLRVEASQDGKHFVPIAQLVPPRSGWLDWDAGVTHAIPATTAKYFRFRYDPDGSEPGAEDLDGAKWKPSLRLKRLKLSGAPKVHQYEGKSGLAWRVSPRTTAEQVSPADGIPTDRIIDLTAQMDSGGQLVFTAPADGSRWVVLRMGYTSTGHKNETAGAGKGLECDKFNPQAVELQFRSWFMEAKEVAGEALAARVLAAFHVDSWECGSQNWSPIFRAEFMKRRGYDPLPYLPVVAGIPVGGSDTAEAFLYDMRRTISELMEDNFFGVLRRLTQTQGVHFTAEATAPVMAADGLVHFREVDIPMGEYWLRSPSHDKPNDIQDALSGGHIYGKRIIKAEAFTQIRMEWNEHPGNLKLLQDRNYAMGINNLVYHVYTHNPWMEKKPGMTLDGIGLYFQRDQTWWKPGKAWVDYATRNHALLQRGYPVRDVAVFIGEEFPRRSILPDRLVNTLPGLFGAERIRREAVRLQNAGNPTQRVAGVTTGANMAQPEDWIDPLNGYAYDCFNPDALLRLATVIDGKVRFGGGNAYSVLVLPGKHPMQPHPELMTPETATTLLELVEAGAVVILGERPQQSPGLADKAKADSVVRSVASRLFDGPFTPEQSENGTVWVKRIGEGKVIKGPYTASTLEPLGILPDVQITEPGGSPAVDVAWHHRRDGETDIYFVSNQREYGRQIDVSFRTVGRYPVLYDAVDGKLVPVKRWYEQGGRAVVALDLAAGQSVFVIFDQRPVSVARYDEVHCEPVTGPWQVQFDPAYGGPEQPVVFQQLTDWTTHADRRIAHYSGTASYHRAIRLNKVARNERILLELDSVANLAEIVVNGKACGVVWTAPYRLDITGAVRRGHNIIEIKVTNTWANRLIGDHRLDMPQRITHTNAPYRLLERLYPAGLLGTVRLITERIAKHEE
ncbi:Glycosyl hydrolases family 2, sugar binding domain [Parapedobacter composti]|uniref:Glycosyl hydrolases family 2, sugar binding domain n=1 Tax=Parapedobacter composti TaxID=623281 RepID=A0A1I1GT14_9SPHI|nr:glycosyl hydrolase [Parapedobacter composti]SFC14646.1 Glycosyl hydrolases family 2, sugar binding domain [Parapedobacter composti]